MTIYILSIGKTVSVFFNLGDMCRPAVEMDVSGCRKLRRLTF